jgi:hypothetical protein
VAEGDGLLNRIFTFSTFVQNTNESQCLQSFLRFLLSILAARRCAILTRYLSATVGNFRQFENRCRWYSPFGGNQSAVWVTQQSNA